MSNLNPGLNPSAFDIALGQPFELPNSLLSMFGWSGGRLDLRTSRQTPEFSAKPAPSWGKWQATVKGLQLQHAALEAAANAIVVTDLRGHVVWSNPAFSALTGYKPSEIVGRNMRFLKSGVHVGDFYTRMWKTILAGRVWRAEVINQDKNGKHFVAEQTITPMRDKDGAISHFISIQQDITTQWRLHVALRESQERLKNLSDAAFEGIVIHERGQILAANQVFTETFGYTPLELMTRPVLDLFDPVSRPLVQENLLVGRGQPYEVTGRRKDGEGMDLQVRHRLTSYLGRKAEVTSITDITGAKRDRERLRSLERQKAIEAERSRVARDMHDELGSILTRIKLLSERLERDAGRSDSVIEHARLISRSSRDLAQRMDEIVWAADPRKDRLENLGSYLVAYAQDFLELADLRCRFDLPEVLPEIPLSAQVRHCIFLVVKEALTNVVKHARASEVELRLDFRDSQLELEVRDDGCGFDPRGANAQRNGLRNLRRRLSELGGECSIKSRLGRGTAVRITLFCAVASGPDPKTGSPW
jgi:PAS domain S-box-containing protein